MSPLSFRERAVEAEAISLLARIRDIFAFRPTGT